MTGQQTGQAEQENSPLSGADPEALRAIVPNLKECRDAFWRMDYALVAVSVLTECAFFLFCLFTGRTDGDFVAVFLPKVGLPAFFNLLILLFVRTARHRLPDGDLEVRQNVIPIFAMVGIALVLGMAHGEFFAVLLLFVIPVGMTTVFSNRKLSGLVTVLGIVGILAVSVRNFLVLAGEGVWTEILAQMLIAVIILVLAGKTARVALNMTEGQRGKLTRYAGSIREAQHKAEAANVAKSAFLANMSHEIRTPINAILGMNEMILRENDSPQIEEYAESVRTAGNALLYLVNDVLDISKIESGKLEIVPVTYDTASLIHDSCNMIADRAASRKLDFRVNCSEALPSRLYGDEVRLRQVVTNLLSNAVKYTEKGSVTLSVEGRREKDGFLLEIAVRDTGIGIREENLENLFSQFTRFDLEKNRNIEGTGLGLAITKRLVDLMQGEIRVESIYGIGSAFTVTVPQQVMDETPMGDFQMRHREAEQSNEKYHQSFEAPDVRVLVVDDVEVNLKVFVNLLKKTKIRVDTATSGQRCLELVCENAYDLIFLDHMMPEMDGIETYHRIKESENPLNRETPVIMLTANAISGVRENYLEEGFADYLSKPVRGDKLEAMIRKHLPGIEGQPDPAGDGISADDPGAQKPRTQAEAPAKEESLTQAEHQAKEESRTQAEHQAQEESRAQTEAQAQAAAGRPAGSNVRLLQAFFQRYPQADILLGMSYCGEDSDTYVEVLRSFGEGSRIRELCDAFERRDARNYQVLVHGVKSASLSAGLPELSQLAQALEDAAGGEDWALVTERHPGFIAEYQRATDAILQLKEE